MKKDGTENDMSIKIELPARFGHTSEELAFIREMGVEYLNLNVMPDKATLADMREEVKRLAGDIGAPLVSVAWQPNGIFRTGRDVGQHTRGGTAFYADLDEINSRPISNDRVYSRQGVWDNFEWFLERILPVCEESGVRLALHPNDPPLPSFGGVASLICSIPDYRRALALAGGSRALGVKLCVGCWLENPAFGDLLSDIRDFQAGGDLVEVHFRNASSPLPRFEETLCEDGYANMYEIMKTLAACGFESFCSIDHGFAGYPSMGGQLGSMAYPIGYIKGLLHAAERKLRACG